MCFSVPIKRHIIILAIMALCLYPRIAFPQVDVPPWHEIQSPTSENITYARLLNKNHGYIYAEKQQLYEYRDGIWRQIAMPTGVLVIETRVVDSGDVLAIVQPMDRYRDSLMRLKDGQWQAMNPPNVHALRRFHFPTSDSGWAAATWGELLLFRNGKWEQVYFPSPCHIEKFVPGWQNELYAFTDCPPGGRSEILQLIDGKWQHLPEQPGINIRSGLVDLDGSLVVWPDEDTIYKWDGTKFSERPFHSIIKRLAIFPDGSGFHVDNDGIHYFQSLEDSSIQLFPSVPQYIDLKLTISPDRNAWLYGIGGKIWAFGAEPGGQSAPSFSFGIEAEEFGHLISMAVVQNHPDRSDIYIVDNDFPNLIARNIHEPHILSRIEPAEAVHLDEPQTHSGEVRMYDFAAIAGDFNNDLREDIFLTSMYGNNILFLNGGNSTFINATKWSGLADPDGRYGIAATADIDNDGDLDIYVPDEFAAGRLYLNNGYGRFTNQAAERGTLVSYASTAANFADFDMDGWIDLVVTTFREGTRLFRNAGDGFFEDVTEHSPALQPAFPEKCSSLAIADYDNDGDFDLFISKLLASNTLLNNDGTGTFRDVTLQAGLADSAMSRGAVFFDPDQDGDLELFVSNMGHDHYYENLGNATFRANHGKVLHQRPSWVPAEFITSYSGGLSNGAVVFDYGADGDMDLWVSHFDGKSVLYRNQIDSAHFLQLRLFGVRANRTAIGSVVKLFPAGTNFSAEAQLGARMIESTSSYGSHSEKLIHFGVDPGQRYDAEILFPGGAKRFVQDLRPGKSYNIYELEGATKMLGIFRKRLSAFLLGYRSGLRYFQVILLAAFLFTVFTLSTGNFAWGSVTRLILLAGLLTAFFTVHVAITFQNDFLFLTAPLLAGGFGGFLALKSWNWWRLRSIPNADFDSLSMRLTGFAHSEHYANVFASLEFHLKNFQSSGRLDDDIVQRFLQSIRVVKIQMQPDVQTIIACARTLGFQIDRAMALYRAWRRFVRLLRKLENVLLQRRPAATVLFDQLKHVLDEVRLHVRSLRKSVEQLETVDVADVLSDIAAQLQSQQITCQTDLQKALPPAHMPENKLRTVIDELAANAIRAMAPNDTKILDFVARTDRHNRIQIDICDQGKGIVPDQWQAVFQRGFTSKKSGGIGLFLAKQMVERYGGLLEITESSKNGTTFRVTLQRARS